jgi:membrane protease YdiL (CAAX protease family)
VSRPLYEDEEDEQAATAASSDWQGLRDGDGARQRSLALGLVALAPLFLAYELGLRSNPELPRNLAEKALLWCLSPVGEALPALRAGLLAAAVCFSLWLCFRRRLALGPSLMAVIFEGVVWAICIGPLLAFSMGLLGGLPGEVMGATQAAGAPGLALAARLFGGAAFEELLFRVLIFGALYFMAGRVMLFFGAPEAASRLSADGVAIVGSALCFATLHLDLFATHMDAHGEAFSSPVFLWRFLAGILLALLFRLRGLGVAAWTHALFNLALLLGAGVDVLL